MAAKAKRWCLGAHHALEMSATRISDLGPSASFVLEGHFVSQATPAAVQ
jgi:hypothetical protein